MILRKFFLITLFSLPIQLTAFEAVNLNIEETEVIPLSLYKEIQFPQCLNTGLKSAPINDYLGSSEEGLVRAESKSLRNAGKKIRSYHKKIIELRKKGKHNKILEIATEALEFINKSMIFDKSLLIRFPLDSDKFDHFILSGYPMDFLSSQHFSAMMIASLAAESAKKIGSDALALSWAETGIKITRWIFNNRGCSRRIGVSFDSSIQVEDKRIRRTGNICSTMYLKESYLTEEIIIDSLKKKDFDKVVNLASLSLTDLQVTPASQTSFRAAAFIRLNTLARLAYAAREQENWCLTYEGNDRAIKLANELNIEPLNAWKDSKHEASKYYLPNNEDSWSVKYGNLKYENIRSYIPLKQQAPKYPRKLLVKGIEGCVMLNFTINVEGKTEDAMVEWSTHEDFEKPALTSSKGYEYSVPEKYGIPTSISNVKSLIVFKIEDPNKSPYYAPAGCE